MHWRWQHTEDPTKKSGLAHTETFRAPPESTCHLLPKHLSHSHGLT